MNTTHQQRTVGSPGRQVTLLINPNPGGRPDPAHAHNRCNAPPDAGLRAPRTMFRPLRALATPTPHIIESA